jgi:hypothetical protein
MLLACREKQSWFTKMLDPAIRSKWAAEAEAQVRFD